MGFATFFWMIKDWCCYMYLQIKDVSLLFVVCIKEQKNNRIYFYRWPDRSRSVVAQQLHCEKPGRRPLQKLHQVMQNTHSLHLHHLKIISNATLDRVFTATIQPSSLSTSTLAAILETHLLIREVFIIYGNTLITILIMHIFWYILFQKWPGVTAF